MQANKNPPPCGLNVGIESGTNKERQHNLRGTHHVRKMQEGVQPSVSATDRSTSPSSSPLKQSPERLHHLSPPHHHYLNIWRTQLGGGTVTSIIALPTTFTPPASCSTIYRLNGFSLAAFDPGYGLDINTTE
ncbi:hypothetical protein CSAL01_11558 [Colletotrichum salicis]|uniref:Uncharacterized protein n=1 Tax=Colletotrichum salicis TaxID=1209931 RepID=A0A135T2B6_9PEZI|nr:hypothetical protein CSAL01_11558 [Colletotrichum salicis]